MSVLSAALSNDVASLAPLIAGGEDLEATDAVRGGRWGWLTRGPCQPVARGSAQSKASVHKLDTPPPRLAPSRTQDGKTALMCAAKNNAEGMAKLLIEAKAKLEAKDEVRPVGVHISMIGGLLGWRAGRAVCPIAA